MTNKNPLVSVVVPVYNAEKYLVEAFISILNQSYQNIEIIAVNDGSKDSSQEMLEQLAHQDNRLRIINQKNTGIVGALNNGVAAAKGKFIARMDADDVSFLTRFEKQVAALEKHPEAVLVATGFEVIDEDSEFMYREILPTRGADIKRAMLLYNPIAHGSVMFRRSAFEAAGGYSDDCGPTEDYELWSRLAPLGDFIALEGSLYRWRRNRLGITLTNNPAMQAHTKVNLERYWQNTEVAYLNRKELLEIGNFYRSQHPRYGVHMKHTVYANVAQICVKLVRKRRFSQAIKQGFALASTGRTGLYAVLGRAFTIIKTQLTTSTKRSDVFIGEHAEES